MSAITERVREHNAFVRWFRQLACKRNDVPYEDTSAPVAQVEHVHRHEHTAQRNREDVATTAPQPAPSQPAAPATAAPARNGNGRKWWHLPLAAGLAGVGVGVPAGAVIISQMGGDGQHQAPIERGSVLQYLEDEGFHLPDGRE